MPKTNDSEIAGRVVQRYAATQLDEKMKALLLKLRKGADASLSLGQLFKVLALLGGWRVEEIVGLAQIHYPEFPHALRTEDEARARSVYDNLKSRVVTTLPTSPKLGEYYVMDLAPFTTWEHSHAQGRKEHGAEYKLWAGVPGYRFTDPQGKIFELLPDRYDFGQGQSLGERQQGLPTFDAKKLKKQLRVYNVTGWLKEHTSYIAQINELLGMEEHVPAAKRTRDNTGTCAACFRNIKIVRRGEPATGENTAMALHGYNRPGHGYIIGKCWGGNHEPYELGCTATKVMLRAGNERVASLQKYLDSLSSPDLVEFNERQWWGGDSKPKVIRKGDLLWEYTLRDHIKTTEQKVKQAEHERDIYKWLVENWQVRELPHQGDKEIDWFTIAARKVRAE